jgi:hypothetical protein
VVIVRSSLRVLEIVSSTRDGHEREERPRQMTQGELTEKRRRMLSRNVIDPGSGNTLFAIESIPTETIISH